MTCRNEIKFIGKLNMIKETTAFETLNSVYRPFYRYEEKGNEKKEIEKGRISKRFMSLRNCPKYCFLTPCF